MTLPRTILLVEDDLSVQKLVKTTLELNEHKVLTASNGLVGYKQAIAEKPDLIILETMLPGLDGFEICRRLRKDKRTEDLPIMILSAEKRDVDIIAGYEVGANEYLTKPVNPAALMEKVDALLEIKTASGDRMLSTMGFN